jgi:hypothetical protein
MIRNPGLGIIIHFCNRLFPWTGMSGSYVHKKTLLKKEPYMVTYENGQLGPEKHQGEDRSCNVRKSKNVGAV